MLCKITPKHHPKFTTNFISLLRPILYSFKQCRMLRSFRWSSNQARLMASKHKLTPSPCHCTHCGRHRKAIFNSNKPPHLIQQTFPVDRRLHTPSALPNTTLKFTFPETLLPPPPTKTSSIVPEQPPPPQMDVFIIYARRTARGCLISI